MEIRDLEFRFAVDEAGTFDGYAVLWGVRNLHGEMYRPGAFRRSLEEHRQIGSRPVMLWGHDQNHVIGVWTEIREDAKGLFVRGQILMDTVKGHEAASALKAGAVSGLSIGFRKRKDIVERGVRTLLDVDLAEISIVSVPSAGRARISNYRHSPGRQESAAAFVNACRQAKRSLETKR